MTFKIDKNIPLPSPRVKGNDERKIRDNEYSQFNGLEKMEIGDSVLLDHDSERSGLRSYLINFKRLPWKILSRTTNEGKIRVWRVS